MRNIYLLLFLLSFTLTSYSQTGKVVFLELKTGEPVKGSKDEVSQTIDYTVPVGKYLKIESAIVSPIMGNSEVCFLYLNGKMISHYSFIRPPLVVSAPLPIYLPAGKYQFKMTGSLSNAFVSGMEY